jgi:hypothetical protein
MFSSSAVLADLHEADKNRCLGCQGYCGLWRHALFSFCTLLGKPVILETYEGV